MVRRVVVIVLCAFFVAPFTPPFAAANTPECDEGEELPLKNHSYSCTGEIYGGLLGGTDVDAFTWKVYRGWDLHVTLTLLAGGTATITRSVNGTTLGSASGSGPLVLPADLLEFPNPHDRAFTEVIRVEGSTPAGTASFPYLLEVSRTRDPTICPMPIPMGETCEGKAPDGALGYSITGPRPNEYRWFANPQDAVNAKLAYPAGKVTTLYTSVRGHSYAMSATGPHLSSSASLRPAQGADVTHVSRFFAETAGEVTLTLTPTQPDKHFYVIHHPPECGKLGCWPGWDEYVQDDQRDDRSFGPVRFSVRLAHEPDAPPVAAAGPDIVVVDHNGDLMETVQLDGRASTDDFRVKTWTWSDGSNVIATGPVASLALGLGIRTIDLDVADDVGQTSTDSLQLSILANEPPIARAGPDRVVYDDDGSGAHPVTLDGRASYDSGGIVSYLWKRDSTPLGTGATLTSVMGLGVHNITLTVADAAGATSTDDVRIEVLPNAPPVPVILLNCLDNECAMDSRLSHDPDGAIVSRVWSRDGVPFSNDARVRGIFPYGPATFTLTLTDNAGSVASASVTRSITMPGPLPVPTTVVSPYVSDPPNQPTPTPEAGQTAGGALDVWQIWMRATSEEIGLGMRVADLRFPQPGVDYRVHFRFGNEAYYVVASETNGAPEFSLKHHSGADAGALTGSWSDDFDIIWWSVPRDRVGSPPPGQAVTNLRGDIVTGHRLAHYTWDGTPVGSWTLPTVAWP